MENQPQDAKASKPVLKTTRNAVAEEIEAIKNSDTYLKLKENVNYKSLNKNVSDEVKKRTTQKKAADFIDENSGEECWYIKNTTNTVVVIGDLPQKCFIKPKSITDLQEYGTLEDIKKSSDLRACLSPNYKILNRLTPAEYLEELKIYLEREEREKIRKEKSRISQEEGSKEDRIKQATEISREIKRREKITPKLKLKIHQVKTQFITLGELYDFLEIHDFTLSDVVFLQQQIMEFDDESKNNVIEIMRKHELIDVNNNILLKSE